MKKIRRYFRVHFDIPSIIVILIIILIVYIPSLNITFKYSEILTSKINFPEWIKDVGLHMLSEILVAAIIIPITFYFLRINARSSLVGIFEATIEGETEPWGTVKLSYNLFSNKIKGVLYSEPKNTEIEIEAYFERGEYLRGNYIEKKKLNRRRMGAFLLVLDGEGDNFSGTYVSITPESGDSTPKTHNVTWKKISD